MAEGIESELKVYFGAGDVVAPEDFPYQARGIAESLAKKGYRKESDTAKEILGLILAKEFEKGDYLTDDELKKLVGEKYGVDLGE
jgi:hypothetical protein